MFRVLDGGPDGLHGQVGGHKSDASVMGTLCVGQLLIIYGRIGQFSWLLGNRSRPVRPLLGHVGSREAHTSPPAYASWGKRRQERQNQRLKRCSPGAAIPSAGLRLPVRSKGFGYREGHHIHAADFNRRLPSPCTAVIGRNPVARHGIKPVLP